MELKHGQIIIRSQTGTLELMKDRYSKSLFIVDLLLKYYTIYSTIFTYEDNE